MKTVRRQGPFGVMTEWWTLAARVLALLLALMAAAPEAGFAGTFAADLHHHLGSPSSTPAMSAEAPGTAQAADPGLAAHLHCGCHVAAPVSEPDPLLPAARPRPRYGRIALAPSSVVPDLLPRPPRA